MVMCEFLKSAHTEQWGKLDDLMILFGAVLQVPLADNSFYLERKICAAAIHLALTHHNIPSWDAMQNIQLISNKYNW